MIDFINIGGKEYPFRLTVFCLDYVAKKGGYKFQELEKFMNEDPLNAVLLLLKRGLNKGAIKSGDDIEYSDEDIEDMIGMDIEALNDVVEQVGALLNKSKPTDEVIKKKTARVTKK